MSSNNLSLEYRFRSLMKVSNNKQPYQTSREFTKLFIEDPTCSDVTTTGHILNILALAGIFKKRVVLRQDSFRATICKFKRVNSND
jgi:hypothetical protein